MTRDDWEDLLDGNHQDREVRLFYSVWLRDEMDDPVAADCQLFLADHPPFFVPKHEEPIASRSWTYGCAPDASNRTPGCGPSILLPAIYDLLTGSVPKVFSSVWKNWRTRREAEDAILVAYRRLSEEQRLEVKNFKRDDVYYI